MVRLLEAKSNPKKKSRSRLLRNKGNVPSKKNQKVAKNTLWVTFRWIFVLAPVSTLLFLRWNVRLSVADHSGDSGQMLSSFLAGAPPSMSTSTAVAVNTSSPFPTTGHNESISQRSNEEGLILTSMWSYRQDPRRMGKFNHTLPTYEHLYHFSTTVLHYKLKAIIFHDGIAFDDKFVEKHTHEPYIQFRKVDAPTFDNGEPIITPNDFRYIVFDKFLKEEQQQLQQNDSSWYLIADIDVFFNRNPFQKLEYYHKKYNQTFFGSFDGGKWKDEKVRLQRKLFRKCYGLNLVKQFREDGEWETPNGNCGLWAGKPKQVRCVMDCMAQQYNQPPVQGKGATTLCDMVVHDYCVFYGGCFEKSTKGVYNTQSLNVRWGPDTQGEKRDLFGPPYGRAHESCIWDSWTAVHDRCDTKWKPPICFRTEGDPDQESSANLVKYYQHGQKGKYCKLDKKTDLPLPVG